MPRTAKILSARAVSELRWRETCVDMQGNPIPDLYPVGGATGLYIQVTKDLGRSWKYRYTSITGDNKRIPMGLGSYTYKSVKNSEALTLQQAREVAQHWAGVRAKGFDPKTVRDAEEREAAAAVAKSITFKVYAENEFLPMKLEEYKNPDSYRRIKQILEAWIFPIIGQIAISDIERVHAIEVLKQKVDGKRLIDAFVDLPDRCHIYITQVLRKAKADGLIDQIPFVWKDDLEFAFYSSSKDQKKKKKSWHRPALNYRKLPKFFNDMMALDKPKGSRPDVQCMLFGILTQARSNEARLVTWEEIDLRGKVWHITFGLFLCAAKRSKLSRLSQVQGTRKAEFSVDLMAARFTIRTFQGWPEFLGIRKTNTQTKFRHRDGLCLTALEEPSALGRRQKHLIVRHLNWR